MAEKGKDDGKINSISTKSSGKYKTLTFTVPTIRKLNIKIPENKKARVLLVVLAFILAAVGSGFLGGWIESNGNTIVLGSTSLGNQKQIVTSDSQLVTDIQKQLVKASFLLMWLLIPVVAVRLQAVRLLEASAYLVSLNRRKSKLLVRA